VFTLTVDLRPSLRWIPNRTGSVEDFIRIMDSLEVFVAEEIPNEATRLTVSET
jgi:hypothetical protein